MQLDSKPKLFSLVSLVFSITMTTASTNVGKALYS